MGPTGQPPKLPYIQCLRALAACGVVMLHAQMMASRFSSAAPLISLEVAEVGRYGIDLFFVISGFVIYYTNFPRVLSAGKFIRRRALRIIPLYWTLTLLAFAARRLLPETVFASQSPSVPELLLSMSFLSGRQPIILGGWTLEFEMFFYGCAALAIGLSGPRWTCVAYLLIAFAVVGRFIPIDAGPLGLMLDPFLLEFVYGLIAAEIFCTGRLPIAKLAVTIVAVLLTWSESESILWAGLPSALLVYGAARLGGGLSSGIGTRICAELGNASYSIYLIQFFTLPVIARAIHLAFRGEAPNLIFMVGFLGTLAAGYCCYRCVERPLMAMPYRKWGAT